MLLMQVGALAIAVFLILRADILASLGGEGTYGNPVGLETLGLTDSITIGFWSIVVFVYFFMRFRDWADEPPAEFQRTPPRHCTTRSRYTFAQFAYACAILLLFWSLTFVPQLLDEIVRAISLLAPGAAEVPRAAFDDPELGKEIMSGKIVFRSLAPAAVAPYAAVALLVVFRRFPVEPAVRAFFQRRALIPSEARRIIIELSDSASRFAPDRASLERLADGPLKGVVDPLAEEQRYEDVVLVEHVYGELGRESDPGFDTALRHSDFDEIGERILGARQALRELVDDAAELMSVLDPDLANVDRESTTLDVLDANRVHLSKDRERVFDKAFKARRREALGRYKALRQDLTRLMTTLVLACDSSANAREVRFASFGFRLEATSAPVPRYAKTMTFATVFVLCLLVSLSYYYGYEQFRAIAAAFSAVPIEPAVAEHPLRIATPRVAVYWSFIGALMQMFAVGVALAAWSLSADWHFFEGEKGVPLTSYVGALLTGATFGFVADVLVYFVLEIVSLDQMILQQNWPWALLGGVTGAFLVVQGIHVRRGRYALAMLWALTQGAVSAITAVLIALVWGAGNIPVAVLGPFAAYVGVAAAISGFAVGLLAMIFMRGDELGTEPRALAGLAPNLAPAPAT